MVVLRWWRSGGGVADGETPPPGAYRGLHFVMTMLHRLWAGGVVGVTLAAGLTSAAAAQTRDARIDAIFRGYADAPGCAVGIRHNGAVVHRAGYGVADLEHGVPITPASVFYTGSLSKQFTATALALAEREGVLDVDDPLRKWLPEFDVSADGITLRHLVHHTGGLREKWALLAMQGLPAGSVITQQMTIDLLARQRGVLFPAGQRYSYSNSGYDMMATAIERASGESLRAFADKRIFAPLGMRTARFGDHWGEVIPGRVMGYGLVGGEWQRWAAMVETVGSGSVYASVDDLLTWLAAWEGDLLGDSTLIGQLETTGRLGRNGPGGNGPGGARPVPYGWGLVVDQWQGRRRVHHTGALAGYRTAMWRLPSERWAAVLLCNTAEVNSAELMEQVARVEFPPPPGPVDQLGPMRTGPDVPKDTSAFPDDIPGVYWSDELQVHWIISRRDSTYVMKVGSAAPVPVVGIHREAVRIGNWLAVINRDADAAITGFTVNGVRFVRDP